MENTSYQLIIAYFEKTITDEGLTELQEWIEASPENLAQFSETIQILEASKSYFKQSLHAEDTWAKIKTHIQEENVHPTIPHIREIVAPRKKSWFPYAAALILLGLLGLSVFKYHPSTLLSMEYQTVSNADGKQSRLTLPDSSIVYLAGGSSIRYPKYFGAKTRAVVLDGEAFFSVVHHPEKPFTVATGDITTVVLGTSFNVKAYAAESKVAVTVSSGKVGVMALVKGRRQLIKYLLPNDQISINTRNGIFTSNQTDATAVSSWIRNDFIFYNTSLEEIAVSLEHHYGIQIEFTDPDLSRVRLTAKFRNISLKETMDNLTLLSGLAYTQNGRHLFISNNHQKGGRIMK